MMFLLVSFSASSQVIGYLDKIVKINEGGFEVRGWACDTNQNTSIRVYIKVNINEDITSGMADLPSESAISSLCGTNGINHRFRIAIPENKLREHQGNPITAYGKSVSGGSNNALISPNPRVIMPTTNVRGNFEYLIKEEDKYYIGGWACNEGVDESTLLHIYVDKSAYVGGSYAFKGYANIYDDVNSKIPNSIIESSCLTQGVPHRFKLEISETVIQNHKGKNLIVHGIDPTSGGSLNMPITANSTFSVPPLIVNKLGNFGVLGLQYEKDNIYEIITGFDLAIRTIGGPSWTKIDMQELTRKAMDDVTLTNIQAHSLAWKDSGRYIVVVPGNNPYIGGITAEDDGSDNIVTKGYYGGEDMYTVSGCLPPSYDYCITNPHDILYNPTDDFFYVIDSKWHNTGINEYGHENFDHLIRFKDLKSLALGNFEKLELTSLQKTKYEEFGLYNVNQWYSYSRGISLKDNKIHIAHSSYGDVIIVDDFDAGDISIKHVDDGKKDANGNIIPAVHGTYQINGLVLTDVEFYDGYYYGTNNYISDKHYFPLEDYYENRFIRWKTWEEFEQGKFEDLSYLLAKVVIHEDGTEDYQFPYSLTVRGDLLYVATLIKQEVYVLSTIDG